MCLVQCEWEGEWAKFELALMILADSTAATRQNKRDRQTTTFIDYSIEAGILLGGNGDQKRKSFKGVIVDAPSTQNKISYLMSTRGCVLYNARGRAIGPRSGLYGSAWKILQTWQDGPQHQFSPQKLKKSGRGMGHVRKCDWIHWNFCLQARQKNTAFK